MADLKTVGSIAHDVAVESEMAHESLSALTSVVQEGIDRTAAQRGGLPPETIAELRAIFDHESDDPPTRHAMIEEWFPKLLDMVGSPLLAGEPDGMETTEEERARWADANSAHLSQTWYDVGPTVKAGEMLRLLRDFDRLLARETKAREGPLFDILHKLALERGHKPDIAESPFDFLQRLVSRP